MYYWNHHVSYSVIHIILEGDLYGFKGFYQG